MEKDHAFSKLCRNIRYLRLSNHQTKKDMAACMGISVSTLNRIEQGQYSRTLNSCTLCRLCDRFEIPADVMLYRELNEETIGEGH